MKIRIKQGDVLKVPFRINDENVYLNLGWNGLFQVRKYVHSQAVISTTHVSGSTSGITFSDNKSGVVIIPSSITRNVKPDLYQYSLSLLSPDGENFTVLESTVQIEQDLTYTEETLPESSEPDAYTIDEFDQL